MTEHSSPGHESPAPQEATSAGPPDASPARRLRLSQILIDLSQGAVALEPPPAIEPQSGAMLSGRAPVGVRGRIRSRLQKRPRRRIRSNIRLGEILDRTGHAGFGISFGFLSALLALLSLPLPGLSWPMGLGVCLLGLQMVIGGDRPWLPARARRHAVSMQTLNWISDRLARWTRGLERIVYPRFSLLTRGPFWVAIGIALMVHGIGLFLPLPIPGSNLVFIIPILLYAIGLLEDDGLAILLGHALTTTYAVLACAFWSRIEPELIKLWHMVAG